MGDTTEDTFQSLPISARKNLLFRGLILLTYYDQEVRDLERNRGRGVCEQENRAILTVYPADFTQQAQP